MQVGFGTCCFARFLIFCVGKVAVSFHLKLPINGKPLAIVITGMPEPIDISHCHWFEVQIRTLGHATPTSMPVAARPPVNDSKPKGNGRLSKFQIHRLCLERCRELRRVTLSCVFVTTLQPTTWFTYWVRTSQRCTFSRCSALYPSTRSPTTDVENRTCPTSWSSTAPAADTRPGVISMTLKANRAGFMPCVQ